MTRPSLLRSVYDNLNRLPDKAKAHGFSLVFTNAVKYTRTSGVRYETISPERSVVTMKNRKKVQNHIGGVHAVASALLAETATGSIVALNLNADQVPVIKRMELDYVKRAVGNMRAEAHLTPAQINEIQSAEKGEVDVAVTITDAEGKQPILGRMLWAWIPKQR